MASNISYMFDIHAHAQHKCAGAHANALTHNTYIQKDKQTSDSIQKTARTTMLANICILAVTTMPMVSNEQTATVVTAHLKRAVNETNHQESRGCDCSECVTKIATMSQRHWVCKHAQARIDTLTDRHTHGSQPEPSGANASRIIIACGASESEHAGRVTINATPSLCHDKKSTHIAKRHI